VLNIKTKGESTMNFNWIEKNHYASKGMKGADLTITNSCKEAKKEKISFRFRNGTYKKITQTNYIVFSIIPNRIYFKESDANKGFKLTGYGKYNDSCSFQVAGNYPTLEGSYTIEYDKKEGLYFIDLEKNLDLL
jgi:hypothetical protein